MSQVTTITFFTVSGLKNKFWALGQMGRGEATIAATPGLLFAKMLGSGNGNGFSLRPDFSTYALLTVWENEKLADTFFSHHKFMLDYKFRADRIRSFFLRAHKAHGCWNKLQPFKITGSSKPEASIVVLTRARIRPKLLWQFWKEVPDVSKSMVGAKGLLFSKGVGERPLIYQATVSLWENREKMVDFAYRNPKHADVIKKTRELDWYSEELFAEFELVKEVDLI